MQADNKSNNSLETDKVTSESSQVNKQVTQIFWMTPVNILKVNLTVNTGDSFYNILLTG